MNKESFKQIAVKKQFSSGYHHVVYIDEGYIETFIISNFSYDYIWKLDCTRLVSPTEYNNRLIDAKKKDTTIWIRRTK